MLERFGDGTYVLGTRVFNLAATAVGTADHAIAVSRVLQDLRDLTGETVSVLVRRGDQRVCVASATSKHQLRRVVPVGDSMNLVGTVPGDIFLVHASEAERDAQVSAVLSGSERVAQLARIQFAAKHGYSAYTVEAAGITGIAVPVRTDEKWGAALAVSGPSSRFTLVIAESWLPDLRTAARRLEPWMQSD
jgi:DNA-binding IclR family transcriptional regulator